jgi:hypothetical protein
MVKLKRFLSLLQKYQKSIEKKSSPQELERIGTEFFISVPLEAFLKMVFIRWAYKFPVLNLLVAV